MTTLIGLSGSLRRDSYNTSLLRAAHELVPSLELVSLRGIPLYDGDVEREQGIPAEVAALKDRIAAADGLVLATPEYNGSIPGVFKNAIDWLSRPASDIARVFRDKPVAILGATPGRAGTRLAQAAWLPILRQLGARTWNDKQLFVAGAGKVFDAQGVLVDPDVARLLGEFMTGFVECCVKR